MLFCGCLFCVLCIDFVLIGVKIFLQGMLQFRMLLSGVSGVQCGLSRGEVCLEPAAEETGHSVSVVRCLSCGLLSRCAGLLRGIENVCVVFVGLCVPRGHLVVLSSAIFVLHGNYFHQICLNAAARQTGEH